MSGWIMETKNLCKEHRLGPETVYALTDLNVQVAHGEMVSIMGPSGSGKSTCMHLLGCLDTATSGEYFFDGVDVAKLSRDELAETRNEKVGFVFQSFNLLPRATALQNVELPMMYARCDRTERRKRAASALESVGLGHRMDHAPTQLSGGEMQRVAIARALVNEPRLLLADEPTGALDSRTGIEILALFQTLNERGITVCLVTHDAEVAQYAQRILRFRDGRLIADEQVAKPRRGADTLAAMELPDPKVAAAQ